MLTLFPHFKANLNSSWLELVQLSEFNPLQMRLRASFRQTPPIRRFTLN